jgi:DNA-binding response OmpR family regulator
MSNELVGRRIMVVEDESLVAMLLETALEDAECVIVGPYGRLRDALAAAEHEAIDAALLDVNLVGEKVFPVAEMLDKRGVPFLLLSGYGERATPPEHPEWRTHNKPFDTDQLLEALAGLIRQSV